MQPIRSTPQMEQQAFRLTVLWAFTEVSLGGLMHAARIPFSGMFVGGVALLTLFLLARYTRSPMVLFRAFCVVAAMKALATPHASPFAYLAMSVQFLCGLLLTARFAQKRWVEMMILFLGFMYSPFQKIIVTWIVLGERGVHVISDWLRSLAQASGFSFLGLNEAVLVYLSLYVFAAFFLLKLASEITSANPQKALILKKWEDSNDVAENSTAIKPVYSMFSAWRILLLLLIGSWLIQMSAMDGDAFIPAVMLRPIVIIISWIFVIRPVFSLLLSKIAGKKSAQLHQQIREAQAFFPQIARMVRFSVKTSPWYRPDNMITVLFIVLLHVSEPAHV